jgi:ubiquinone/menaquinone biosynthesis C-methylase UbiE
MTSTLDNIRDQQRQTWDRFSAGWKSWDAIVGRWLAPVGETMMRQATLTSHADVLDVASGTGEPGLTAAAQVPHGRVTLTDLSEQMLAVASGSAADRGLLNVATKVCDAGSLPFADESFDAVLCRFGFMFFPDVHAAADELVRVARPRGRVVAAVWATPEDNAWATTIMATITRHVTLPASPPEAPGLFRCAPDDYMHEVFARAGLRDITQEQVSFALVLDSAEQYWTFMTDVAAPVVAGLARADEAAQHTIRDEVLHLAQNHLRAGHVSLPSTATVITGTR